jgi:hypothetical protein
MGCVNLLNIMIKPLPFCLFLSLFCQVAYSQTGNLTGPDLRLIQNIEDTISVLSRGVMNAEIADERLYACHQMIPTLVRALKTKHSFDYPFPRLENVSISYPADSSFRIFSWQLKISDGEYKYFGAIQWNQPALKLVALADRSDELIDPEQAILKPGNWYGAVYYNILPFKLADQSQAWLLFGYDSYSVTERRKIIDVFRMPQGQPVFGAPVFKIDKNLTKTRLVYQFSADAAIRVNYDEQEKMIICDHLTSQKGQLPGQGMTMVPDGSYEGFKLEKGSWKYIEEVFPSGDARNQRAFRTKPVKETSQEGSKPNKQKN